MTTLKRVLFLCCFFVITQLGTLQTTQAQISNDSTFLILFKPNTTANEIEALRLEFNSTELWISPYSKIRYWKVNSFPFTLANGQVINDINEGTEAANERSSVDGASNDYETYIPTIDKGPVNHPGQLVDGCTALSDLTGVTPDVGPNQSYKIAIFDTGIAQFGDTSMFYNDVFGGDYIGRDFVNDDLIPEDDHGHGTHIAGIITRFENANFLDKFDFYIYKTHNQSGHGYLSDIVLAMDEAMINNVDIINMSFSFAQHYDPSSTIVQPLQYQIKLAEGKGILVLASAGNAQNDNDSEYRFYPASYDNQNIISIASVKCNNRLAGFSNYGATTVDVATPGQKIVGPDANGHPVLKSGTSQSCAIATKTAMVLTEDLGYADWKEVKCKILKGSVIPNVEIQKDLLEGIINVPNSLSLTNCSPQNSSPYPDLSFKQILTEDIMITNPVREKIQLQYRAQEDFRLDLSLVDLSGKQIISYLGIENENITIPVATLPSGLYILKIKDRLSGKELIKKIVKQ